MKLLAIETTGRAGSVAILEDGGLVSELRLNADQRSAQSLAPAIRDLLATAGWQPADIRLVAVAVGPGSFTGLRVGVTTAKTFAYAIGAEVIGVNTLEVIAAQAPVEVARLSVVIDAQRQQVFVGRFERDSSGRLEWRGQTTVLENEAWLASLDPAFAVSGPGLNKLGDRLPPQIVVVDPALWEPQAATIGRMAFGLYQSGRRDDLWRLVPHYFRRSAAEEKLDPTGG